MSFQSLQRAFNQQVSNPQQQVDPTKDVYLQGANFAKEMAGERGIMAAIEGAHLRPYIQKYIKSKLLTSDNPINTITNDINRVREGAARMLQTGGRDLRGLSNIRPGQGDIPPVTENRVMTRNPADPQQPLESTIETGEDRPSTLRGSENVGRVEGEGEFSGLSGQRVEGTAGSRAAAREASIQEAESDPVSFGKAPAGSIGGAETPPLSRAAPRVPRGVQEDEPFEALFRNPPARTLGEGAQRLSGGRIRSQSMRENLSSTERQAIEDRSATEATRTPGGLVEPTPAPRIPVLPQEPPIPPPARAAPVRMGERSIPKPEPEPSTPSASTPAEDRPPPARAAQPEQEPEITPDDFPSPPQTTPGRVTETGDWEGPIPPPARAAQPTPTQQTPEDEFGLPRGTTQPTTEPTTEPTTGPTTPPKPTINPEEQEAADRAMAEKLASQETKAIPEEAAEAEVPGVGTILAVGTALYGAIKSAVMAHKEKVEAQDYRPPQIGQVGLDSVPTFDSVFRG